MIPVPECDNLIERITERVKKGPLSEFEFRRFANEAEKLKEANPEAAYSALGILACLKKDAAACRKNHGKAIRIAPASSFAYYNYAVSLAQLGAYDEATKQIKKAVRLNPTNSMLLNELLGIAYAAGDSALLHSGLERWHHLTGKRHEIEDLMEEDRGDGERVDAALADAKHNGVLSWDAFLTEKMNA